MGLWDRIASACGLTMPKAQGAAGMRAYAVGDIHGRLDLLEELLDQIEADLRSSSARRNFIVFLGDFIDRGPESRGVIERLRSYDPRNAEPVFLAGNHEEFFLRVLQGEKSILDNWLKYGGLECVESYGLDATRLIAMEEEAALRALREAVPQAHVEFLRKLSDTFRFGDYLFVHAGIRPGVPLEAQDPRDLRWIREPFLEDRIDHGFIVVHGHTVVDEVAERPNRIGIDTGAYRTGRLTAAIIEGDKRRFISTMGPTVGQTSTDRQRAFAQ